MIKHGIATLTGGILFVCFCVTNLGAQERQSPKKTKSVMVPTMPAEVQPKPDDVTPPAPITPGTPITLDDALGQASRRNLDLAVAKMEVQKARAKLSSAWGLVLPVVQAKLDYTHMDHADTVDLGSRFAPLVEAMGIEMQPGMSLGEPLLTNPQDKLTGSVEGMLPLINAHSWLTISTAKQGVKVAELSTDLINRQILLGVAQSYFMALTARDLIDFYRSQIVTAKETRRIATARFNAGRGMRIDVIRAETDLEKAHQSLRSALLAFDNARDALGDLIGTKALPLPSGSPTFRVPEGQLRDLEHAAGKNRIDIKTATEKVALMEKQLTASWMKFVPSLGLIGQGSYQFSEMADLGSDDRSRWMVMLSLAVPIYDHFRYADLDEKRAQRRQADLALKNTKQKATLAVRKAYRDYANALTDVATAKKQDALAKEGFKLVDAAYRAGTTTSLDVTQARQAETGAGFNLATSQFRAQMALITLLDTLGENLRSSVKTAQVGER